MKRKILVSILLFNDNGLVRSTERRMRSFLINKNICLYFWLKKAIGKKWAFEVANNVEKTILVFGRETMPYFKKNGMLDEQQE